MKLFFWRSNKEHDELATALAEEFINNYPPELSKNKLNKKIELKFEKTLNNIFSQARNYSNTVKPGIYGKARIGNKFMWTLKDQGYDQVLIDNLTKDLLKALSEKK